MSRACPAVNLNTKRPDKTESLLRAVAISVIILHTNLSGIENDAEKLLCVECSRCILQHFPPAVVRSHHHDNPVTTRADELEICEGKKRRCINQNHLKQFAAVVEKLLPARTSEEFGREIGRAN